MCRLRDQGRITSMLQQTTQEETAFGAWNLNLLWLLTTNLVTHFVVSPDRFHVMKLQGKGSTMKGGERLVNKFNSSPQNEQQCKCSNPTNSKKVKSVTKKVLHERD